MTGVVDEKSARLMGKNQQVDANFSKNMWMEQYVMVAQ